MPGFGPDDVSLQDVRGHGDGRIKNHNGVRVDEYHATMNSNSRRAKGDDEDDDDDDKSATLVIDGSQHSPTWSARVLRPLSRSIDNLPDLESHGRAHQSRKGWGAQ